VRLLSKVLNEGLNTSQTAELVNEELNPMPVGGSGPRKPKSAAAGLKTMENLGKKFLDLCSRYDECVITEIGAKDRHAAKDIERLQANRQLLDEIVEAATGASKAVARLLSDMEKLKAEAEAEKREAQLPRRARRPQQIDENDEELFAI